LATSSRAAQAPAVELQSVRDVLRRAVRRNPTRPWLWFEGETTSLAEIDDRTNRLANGLIGIGARPGEPVAIMLGNGPEFLVTWLAAAKLGLPTVPVNTAAVGREAAHIVAHSDAAIVFVGAPYLDRLPAIRQARPDVIAVAVGADHPGCHRYEELLQARPGEPAARDLHGGSTAAILYTSGTTGHPKGCIVDQEYYLANAARFVGHMQVTAEDRLITPLPLFHMNPQITSVLGSLLTGAVLALVDRFHPTTWWDSVRASGATLFNYLGVMPAMLLGQPPRDDDAAHDARRAWGAGVPGGLHASFEERFGTLLVEAYGMTETGMNFAEPLDERRRIGDHGCGLPFADVEVRVVGDGDVDLGPDQFGQLLLRARDPSNPRFGFMRGYHKDERATEEAWRGGWFHTGDVVARDADGRARFVGRRKEIIRRSGENIAAAEVEEVLRLHPAVADVAVVPVQDPIREQEVGAVIVLGEGHDEAAAADELWEWCAERLAYFKVPRYLAYVESLPRTATEKVAKNVLATQLDVGTLSAHDRTQSRGQRGRGPGPGSVPATGPERNSADDQA
jgi:crotonobetaine/carnitine-CoA ligase